MKNLFHKAVGSVIVVLLLLLLISQPLKAQETDFEGWQVYQAYTRMNSAIYFEAWIFTRESLREAFGFSYLIGYMAGVNNDDFYSYFYKDKIKSEKWYEKGFIDGILDRFLYQSGQCISLQLFDAIYFDFFDYMTPYRAVRKWLAALSVPNYFVPIFACMPSLPEMYAVAYYNKGEVILRGNPTEKPSRPTRSPSDYRNIEEHKNIPPERVAKVPVYNPTDKPTRSKNDDRNIEEHTGITLNPLTEDASLRPKIINRVRSRRGSNRSILRRIYKDWPELRSYVKRNGMDNITVIDSRSEAFRNYSMENITIEIALPGRQYNNNDLHRRIVKRFNANLPEFERNSVRSYRPGHSSHVEINRNRNRRRRNVNHQGDNSTQVRTSDRTGNRTSSQRSGSDRERIERN